MSDTMRVLLVIRIATTNVTLQC